MRRSIERMPRRCPRGVICTDRNTVWIFLILGAIAIAAMWYHKTPNAQQTLRDMVPQVFVVQSPPGRDGDLYGQQIRPDLYPEPVRRAGFGLPAIASRGPVGRYEQVGILAVEGGSSTSAAPDRTILPLYGREMDPRRGKWNYYTRTDGTNPVQVPVRYRNRLCDDDTNGCDEISNDDSIHVPALGRSFKASVYRKSMFN